MSGAPSGSLRQLPMVTPSGVRMRRSIYWRALPSLPLATSLRRMIYPKICIGAGPYWDLLPGADRKSTRVNCSHQCAPLMPSAACKKTDGQVGASTRDRLVVDRDGARAEDHTVKLHSPLRIPYHRTCQQ